MEREQVAMAADCGIPPGSPVQSELLQPVDPEGAFTVVYSAVQKILKAPGAIGHANPHVRTVPENPWAVMERRSS